MTSRALSMAARAALCTPSLLDRPLAAAVGRLWCVADPARRAAVRGNRAALDARFPLHAPFVHYVTAIAGWLRLLDASPGEVRARSRVEGLAPVLAARDACVGTVLVAAHVGEWEWGAAALATRGLEVVAVAGTQMRTAWNPALAAAKLRLGIEVIGPERSPARLVRALRRGAVVALLVDGDLATARREAVLGAGRANLPLGPARLAARAGARLVAGRCERDTEGYRVRILPLDSGLAVGDEAARFEAVRVWLGATLTEDPGRWCLFRRFFEDDRAAGPA